MPIVGVTPLAAEPEEGEVVEAVGDGKVEEGVEAEGRPRRPRDGHVAEEPMQVAFGRLCRMLLTHSNSCDSGDS